MLFLGHFAQILASVEYSWYLRYFFPKSWQHYGGGDGQSKVINNPYTVRMKARWRR